MRKNQLLIIAILTIFSVYARSQALPNSHIKTHSVSIKIGNYNGTGFFYEDSLNCYLASATHVFFHMQNKSLKGNKALIEFYERDEESDIPDTLEIDLVVANAINKASFDFQNDVCVIRIGKLLYQSNKRTGIIFPRYVFRKTNFSSFPALSNKISIPFSDAKPGINVFIIGYPRSLTFYHGIDYNRPIFRQGIIGARDIKAQKIIIDAPVYPGNSGGLALAHRYYNNESIHAPIGVVTEFVPRYEFFEDSTGQPIRDSLNNPILRDIKNSGYSLITPIHFVDQLIIKMGN